jgi:hypothetical protein
MDSIVSTLARRDDSSMVSAATFTRPSSLPGSDSVSGLLSLRTSEAR